MTPLEFAVKVRNRCQTIMVAGHLGRPERCGELAAELATLAGQMVKLLKEGGVSTLETPREEEYDGVRVVRPGGTEGVGCHWKWRDCL